jgi:hypothetical protein
VNHFTNFHVQYFDLKRHWCAPSEKYAGGDCLLSALDDGWEIDPLVRCEDHWHAGVRRVPVYHFTLTRNGEEMKMPVISNPFVERFVRHSDIQLVRMNERRVISRS